MGRAVRIAFMIFWMTVAPQAATEAAPPVLRDGFEGNGFAASGGLYYHENFEQEAGLVEFQSDTVRTGTGALKLSVSPHCPADLAGCSERAEIRERPELRVPFDQAVWYGIAVRFADFIPQKDHRYVIAQWKREIDGAQDPISPFLALRMKRGRLFATIETELPEVIDRSVVPVAGQCPDGWTRAWFRPDEGQMRVLVAEDGLWGPEDGLDFAACTDLVRVTRHGPLPTPDAGWIDFAVYALPGPAGDGRIEIFANDTHIATAEGAIGHDVPGLGPNQYFKFGPYRDADAGNWSLYFDDFRRSPSCADVLEDPGACPEL